MAKEDAEDARYLKIWQHPTPASEEQELS